MAIEIKMPHLSQTTDEVRLIRWIVKEGTSVKKGDPLCEVETDKVTMEVESFVDGTVLKLYAKPDEIVDAGKVIALVGRPDEGAEEAGEKVEERASNSLKVAAVKKGKEAGLHKSKIRATSLVKHLAQKKNIDLENVRGTGAGGLITKQDLEQYILSSKEVALPSESFKREEITLTFNQLAVARNLVKSKREIPHFYLKTEVFTDRLLGLRKRKKSEGKSLSIYSILIYAAAKALKDFPKLNGHFRENRLIVSKAINMGFAVAARDELYAPVIKDADKKSMEQIDIEVKSLVSKARKGALEPEDIIGGTFTVSNLGIYPVDEFYAVINYPQAGIIAMGRIRKTFYIDGENTIKIRSVCVLTGSFDHRIVNGAKGAEFLARCKQIIEEEI